MWACPSLKSYLFLFCYFVTTQIAHVALASDHSSRDPGLHDLGFQRRLLAAARLLKSVPSGQRIISKALSSWKLTDEIELFKVLKPSNVSRTDAVLTRHYDPENGSETIERSISVHLKAVQPVQDLVLDMAHELTHASSPPTWDPYDPDLTVGKYIEAALEGKGGEVDALISECQVSLELSEKLGFSASRCTTYLDEDSHLVREKVQRDFYRVGKWHERVLKNLKEEITLFPLLSEDKPSLYSSTGRTPYPFALVEEFNEITHIACENSRKRLLRGSVAGVDQLKTAAKAVRFLASRCGISSGPEY